VGASILHVRRGPRERAPVRPRRAGVSPTDAHDLEDRAHAPCRAEERRRREVKETDVHREPGVPRVRVPRRERASERHVGGGDIDTREACLPKHDRRPPEIVAHHAHPPAGPGGAPDHRRGEPLGRRRTGRRADGGTVELDEPDAARVPPLRRTRPTPFGRGARTGSQCVEPGAEATAGRHRHLRRPATCLPRRRQAPDEGERPEGRHHRNQQDRSAARPRANQEPGRKADRQGESPRPHLQLAGEHRSGVGERTHADDRGQRPRHVDAGTEHPRNARREQERRSRSQGGPRGEQQRQRGGRTRPGHGDAGPRNDRPARTQIHETWLAEEGHDSPHEKRKQRRGDSETGQEQRDAGDDDGSGPRRAKNSRFQI
jgi:hypothetical protein